MLVDIVSVAFSVLLACKVGHAGALEMLGNKPSVVTGGKGPPRCVRALFFTWL